LRTTVTHQTAGAVDLIANPIRYGTAAETTYTAPPLLGEHTDEILTNVLGKTPDDIAELRANGAT
jgi:crotonobetainyl-CoA:carnitine CoA-transferase CaiB-like acyl-CoA transferase